MGKTGALAFKESKVRLAGETKGGRNAGKTSVGKSYTAGIAGSASEEKARDASAIA